MFTDYRADVLTKPLCDSAGRNVQWTSLDLQWLGGNTGGFCRQRFWFMLLFLRHRLSRVLQYWSWLQRRTGTWRSSTTTEGLLHWQCLTIHCITFNY